MKMVKVEIVKETAKAVYAKDAAGKFGWIPKGFCKGGEVSDGRWQKAVEWNESRESAKKESRAWDGEAHAVEVKRETEKAVACEAVVTVGHSTIQATRLVWFPKSMLKNGGVAGWLIRARAREIEEERPLANAFHVVESIGGVAIA